MEIKKGLTTLPDYRREPQDLMDAAALEHDMNYDIKLAKGIDGALIRTDTKGADELLTFRSAQVIVGYDMQVIDPYTGQKISAETYERAVKVGIAFGILSAQKEIRDAIKEAKDFLIEYAKSDSFKETMNETIKALIR